MADLDPQSAAQAGLSAREGIVVTGVLEDGPAWRGGIRGGDIIVSFGGDEVPTTRELIKLLRLEYKVGQGVAIEVVRQGKRQTFNIVLGERPPQ